MKRITIIITILLTGILQVKGQTLKGYGVTSHGGMNDDGVIFALDPYTNQNQVLFNFNGTDGSTPSGSLMRGPDGLFYGTTTFGGTFGYGVLYSFDMNKNTEAVLVNFDSATLGSYPLNTLVLANDGLLYGTTYSGGQYNYGVLFSFNPANGKCNVLVNYNKTNGEYPIGKLLQASNGILYGMTFAGGSSYNGTLFSYNISAEEYKVLINFGTANGSVPYGSLIESPVGSLYGMTYGGGAYNKGVIFKYDFAKDSESIELSFNGSNGAYPMGSLLQTAGNLLYGLTYAGGDSDMGVVFSFDPALQSENVLFSFTGVNGQHPYGSLALDSSADMIYGMTHWGGINNEGVVFSFGPGPGAENILLNFGTIAGAYPDGELLFFGNPIVTSVNPSIPENMDMVLYPNPAHGNVYLSFKDNETHYIEVDDINGRLINYFEVNERTSLLPTGNLSAGIYVVKMYNQNQAFISSSKLILQ